jgi:hypothetical protein
MAFAAEMRALAYKLTGLLWSEPNLGFLAFLYVAGLDIQPVHLKTVCDIDAAAPRQLAHLS